MLLRLPASCPEHPDPSPSPRPQLPLPPPPQPRPILRLGIETQVLYAEFIATNQLDPDELMLPDPPDPSVMLWVRPLALVSDSCDSAYPELVDLRHTSDLLWPAAHFQLAYVEEVLPLWDRLATLPQDPEEGVLLARRCLQGFMQRVWQVYQHTSSP